MTQRTAPRITKWPFFAGDLLLLGLAIWIVQQAARPLSAWPLCYLVLSVMAGAGLAALPFLIEYRAMLKFAESDNLNDAVSQINQINRLGDDIKFATSQWQIVQEQSAATAKSCKQIADQMASEAQSFTDFMQKANDTERAHLRLEVEKLRRGEAEWLQTMVRLLDHVYALYRAGARSGKPPVHEQLTNFQNACREVIRRIGLNPFEARPGDLFDDKRHQLIEPDAKPPPDSNVVETLATGYTFQGQLLRRALVAVGAAKEPEPSAEGQLTLESQMAERPTAAGAGSGDAQAG